MSSLSDCLWVCVSVRLSVCLPVYASVCQILPVCVACASAESGMFIIVLQLPHAQECCAGSEDALHLLVDRSMRVAETALHSYRSQDKAAGNKAALLLQAVKLLSLLSKCAMPNGGDVSALFEEHMRNAANRRYRTLKAEMQPPVLGTTG